MNIPPEAPPLPTDFTTKQKVLESPKVTWHGWAVGVVANRLHGLADWMLKQSGGESHNKLFEKYEARERNTVSLASAQHHRFDKLLTSTMRTLGEVQEENELLENAKRNLEKRLSEAQRDLGHQSSEDGGERVKELKELVSSLRVQLKSMSFDGEEERVRIPEAFSAEDLAIKFVDEHILVKVESDKKALEDTLVKLGVIDRQAVANAIVCRPRPLALAGEDGLERAKNFLVRELEKWFSESKELIINPDEEEGFLDFESEATASSLDRYLRGKGKKPAQIAEYYGLPERGGLIDVAFKLLLGELVQKGKEVLWNPMEAGQVDGWYKEEMAKVPAIRCPSAPPPPPPVQASAKNQPNMADVFAQIRARKKD